VSVVQYDISILVVVVVVVVVVAFDDRLIKSALNIIDVQRGLLRRVLIEIGYFHIVGRLWDAWDTRLPWLSEYVIQLLTLPKSKRH